MIAASSVTALDPERIHEIFLIEHLNSAGVYAVKVYMMGIPVTVTVDDYLPFWQGTQASLVYASKSKDDGLWMPILEKAAAKLFGNYEVLVGGWMGPAIQMLTGAPYFNIDHSDKSADEVWDEIDAQIRAGNMMTCASYALTSSD